MAGPRRLSVGELERRPVPPERPIGRIGTHRARKGAVGSDPPAAAGKRLRRDAAGGRARRSGNAAGHARRLGVVTRARQIAGVLEVSGLPLCHDEIDATHHAAGGDRDGR